MCSGKNGYLPTNNEVGRDQDIPEEQHLRVVLVLGAVRDGFHVIEMGWFEMFLDYDWSCGYAGCCCQHLVQDTQIHKCFKKTTVDVGYLEFNM